LLNTPFNESKIGLSTAKITHIVVCAGLCTGSVSRSTSSYQHRSNLLFYCYAISLNSFFQYYIIPQTQFSHVTHYPEA
jgi:hypothetical protein